MKEPTEDNPVVIKSATSGNVYHTRRCAALRRSDKKVVWYEDVKDKLFELSECKLCQCPNSGVGDNQTSYAKQIRCGEVDISLDLE